MKKDLKGEKAAQIADITHSITRKTIQGTFRFAAATV